MILRKRKFRALVWWAAVGVLLSAAGCLSEQTTVDPLPKVLEFRLGSDVVGWELPLLGSMAPRSGMLDVIRFVDDAVEDDTVIGVVVRLDTAWLTRAEAQEIAEQLDKVRQVEKKVIAYAPVFDNDSYVLAAQTDRIVMPPSGMLDLRGIAVEMTFFKDLLEKIGVEAEFVRAGRYKAAVEPYTRTELSPEAEAMMNRLLDDLYEQIVSAIAEGRNLEPARVRELIDGGPYTAREALDLGLVDALLYEDTLDEDAIAFCRDEDEGREIEYIPDRPAEPEGPEFEGIGGWFRLMRALAGKPRRPHSDREKIALIRISGMIVPADRIGPFQSGDYTASGEIVRALERARTDSTVKAVVLRVDSPGGSALASDLIWRAVVETEKEKPVVVSMGSVAASGGYYVAMGAGHLLAEPGTITGSIGVFGGKFNLGGLYKKLGIRKQILKRGEHATLYDEGHGFTESERERVEALIEATYREFVTKAAEGRDKTFEEIDAVAQGQVWTGREALEHGLVDELGGLKRAFEVAKLSAGYSPEMKFELLELPEPPSLLDAFLDRSRSGAQSMLPIASELETLRRLVELLMRDRAFALMPFFLAIR